MNAFKTKLHWLGMFAIAVGIFGSNPSGWAQQQDPNPNALTKWDRLNISVQKYCPVMGVPLGTMGTPLKVNVDGQHLFVCCKSCLSKKIETKHWKKIQKRFLRAQGICPVMENPVSEDSESTLLRGQRIYVCCRPCVKEMEKDVKKVFLRLKKRYERFVAQEKQQVRDQLQIAAQRICPVSGDQLGSNGPPAKVRVGNETTFLCSNDCIAKKLDPEHWNRTLENLAAAQGICPIMEKPIHAKMKFAVVDGRRIFVCCPPCISKIQASPSKYVARWEKQLENSTPVKR